MEVIAIEDILSGLFRFPVPEAGKPTRLSDALKHRPLL